MGQDKFNTNVFFSEKKAKELGLREILIVGMSRIDLDIEKNHKKYTLYLPDSKDNRYTIFQEGRKILEKNNSLLEEFIIPKINNLSLRNTAIRGSAGGIIYKSEIFGVEGLILQKKHNPAKNNTYYSGFSGLSSSFEQIINPNLTAFTEGLEEFQAVDHGKKIRFLLETNELPKQIIPVYKKKFPNLKNYKNNRIKIDIQKMTDSLTIKTFDNNILSVSQGLIDINPRSNSFDLIKIINLDLPKHTYFYEMEYGNDIIFLKKEDIKYIWNHWGEEIELEHYTFEGKMKYKKVLGLYDTIVQNVAKNLNWISGPTKFDYKCYFNK